MFGARVLGVGVRGFRVYVLWFGAYKTVKTRLWGLECMLIESERIRVCESVWDRERRCVCERAREKV